MKQALTLTLSSATGARDIVVSPLIKTGLSILCASALCGLVAMVIVTTQAWSLANQTQAEHGALLIDHQHQLRRIQMLELELKNQATAPPPPPPVDAAANALLERKLLLRTTPNGFPLSSRQAISSRFGARQHPILQRVRQHDGVDFSVKLGTPVYATANGIVTIAVTQNASGFGRQVVLEHALGFSTRFAHLNRVIVKPGEHIRKGAVLGYSGNSGSSSGPHLHYEVHYKGKALDPTHFIHWSEKNFESIFSKEPGVPWAYLRKKIQQQSQVANSPSSQKAAF